jgi:hypothetical protein
VEEFHQWLWTERIHQVPKAKLAGAINYLLTRWESFTRFLESGAVPLDNNGAERALKYPILGRKAWRAPEVPRQYSGRSPPRDALLAMFA